MDKPLARRARGWSLGLGKPLVRWIALALGVATLLWLGYSVGRVQSIGDVARLYRDRDTDRYTLTRGGVQVHFERLGGAGKPYIRTADGTELLDFSDWDRSSRITVDGAVNELIRLYPGSAVDYERNRIASTFNGDGWLLQREITLAEDGTVQVEHTFVARRPIQRVDVSVAHFHAFFLNVSFSNDGVVAEENGLTREQMLSSPRAPATYRLRITTQGASPKFRRGEAGAVGPASFIADYSATAPPQDQRVVLGTERIQVERVAP